MKFPASIFSFLSEPQVPTVKCRRLETVDAVLGVGKETHKEGVLLKLIYTMTFAAWGV